MAFENIELFNKIAKDSLEKYGWQDTDEANLIVLSENATYMIKNIETGEKDGVLRISRPGYHTIDELNSEIKWLEQINEYTPLIVANPIKGLNGDAVQIVKGTDKNNYFCIISEYLKGETPDHNNEEQMIKQFEYLGEATAYLHLQTKMWNGASKLVRIDWNYDTIIGNNAAWGRWEDFPEMTHETKIMITKVTNIIEKRLNKYGKNKDNYGLIHADLRLANLLIDGEQIKVIDFDDFWLWMAFT